MQPISGMPARPPGTEPTSHSPMEERPLSTQQRTVLERLVTRLIAITSQQNVEVWAGVKHDLGLKHDAPLLSRHFPAAEQNLNQRLNTAQSQVSTRQTLSQLTELLSQGNNRQAVSDYIRHQFGQTALSQLTPQQLKSVLHLLQQGQLSIPQPQLRPATDRPLLPAEHHSLNQLVVKISAATGEDNKAIWHTLLELSGVKNGDPLPAKHFNALMTFLQARLTLSSHPAPTLHTLQAALKQPMEPQEQKMLQDVIQQNWNGTPQTVLTAIQIQELLHLLFLKRIERENTLNTRTLEVRDPHPIYAPFAPIITTFKSLSAKPGLSFIVLIVVATLLWLVI